jgi:hypothetical protein
MQRLAAQPGAPDGPGRAITARALLPARAAPV